MIFVTVGSQKFQFNRLLKEIDKLVEEGVITDEVFAQIGYSDYKPKNYDFKEFLDREEFKDRMDTCDKVITHGGTGAIIGAVKQGKKVIAVPRLEEFQEHVDNHQIEIVQEFSRKKLIESSYKIEDLRNAIKILEDSQYHRYKSNTLVIEKSIDNFIKNN